MSLAEAMGVVLKTENEEPPQNCHGLYSLPFQKAKVLPIL
jgi:hypothetical protein